MCLRIIIQDPDPSEVQLTLSRGLIIALALVAQLNPTAIAAPTLPPTSATLPGTRAAYGEALAGTTAAAEPLKTVTEALREADFYGI